MSRRIKVIESFSGYRANTVCFNTRASQNDPYGYDSSLQKQNACMSLFQHIMLGASFPEDMIVGELNLEAVLGVSLFVHPEMTLEGECHGVIQSFNTVSTLGDVGLAHIPRDHYNMFVSIQNLVQQDHDTREDKEEAVQRGVRMVSQYIQQGRLPPSNESRSIDVLWDEHDSVIYESSDIYLDVAYREGYLSGVWKGDDETVLFKKSELVDHPPLSYMQDKADSQTWTLEHNIFLRSNKTDWTLDTLKEMISRSKG
jgi:hypothetical protein